LRRSEKREKKKILKESEKADWFLQMSRIARQHVGGNDDKRGENDVKRCDKRVVKNKNYHLNFFPEL